MTGGGCLASWRQTPLMGFPPLRRMKMGTASHTGNTISRLAGVSGSSPFHAFHSVPVRSGLVSCRWRPWGCALQSLPHPDDPYPFRGRVPSCRFLPVRPSNPSLKSRSSGHPRRLARRGAQTATPCRPFRESGGGASHVLRRAIVWTVACAIDRRPVVGRRAEVRRGSPRAAELGGGPLVETRQGMRGRAGKPPSGYCSRQDAVPAARCLVALRAVALMGFRLFEDFPPAAVGWPSPSIPSRAWSRLHPKVGTGTAPQGFEDNGIG